VAFVAEEAARRRIRRGSCPAFIDVSGPDDVLPLVYDESLLEEEERRLLTQSLSGLSERYPDLQIRQ
jgi:hypothetical protein